MPVQRTVLGRAVSSPFRILPRRFTFILTFFALFAGSLIVLSRTASAPSVERISQLPHQLDKHLPKSIPKFSVPSLPQPLGPSAHPPPVQANSTSGETKWHSTWKWLKNPFSSSTTLDENRAVLPPLAKRPPIYTYYDTGIKRSQDAEDAEQKLLLTWRRAWWSQGFKPIVLARTEAMGNPLYETWQRRRADKENPVSEELEQDIMRWLAWDHMGSGILANFLALPMATKLDPLLSFLRRGEYPMLTSYEKLRGALFSGEQKAINDALKAALDSSELSKAKAATEAIPKDLLTLDNSHEGIAYYDMDVLKKQYKVVAEKINDSAAEGRNALAELINSHLHTVFQNLFPEGIAVLRPLTAHMSAVIEPAEELASFLVECPITPMPASCPPNRLNCQACAASHRLKVTTPDVYRNKTGLYTIGTVPHPYTLTTLMSQRDMIDNRYLRRESKRDQWLAATTKEYLGTQGSAARRIVPFKEMVAGDIGSAHGLWFTAEKENPLEQLDWFFGFTLPTEKSNGGVAAPPVPGSEPNQPRQKKREPAGPAEQIPTQKELEKNRELLKRAKETIKSGSKPEAVIRGSVEAWNLADTEAWKFVRAFRARSKVERMKWEEEERKFNSGAGMERASSGLGRWLSD